MRRRGLCGLAVPVAVACAALAASATARAEDAAAVVKFGTAAPEDTPWSKQLSRLKARFEKESGGKLKLKLFLGSVKGGEDAMVRQCAAGSLQAVGVTTAALAILAPELNVLELPYRFGTLAEADRVLDDPEVWALVAKILDRRGLVPYLWSENGWRNFASKTRPILKPADLKGQKMRAQENQVHVKTWEALGASPVPIALPEVLSALQTGVVDGFDNTPLYTFAASWHQGVKHWTVSDHIYQPALIVYNKAFLEAQPADIKKILLSNQKEEITYGRNLIRKLNEPLLSNLAEAGVEVHRLDAAQKEAFAKATRPVYAKVRAGLTAEGKALYDLIEKKLAAK